MATTDLAPASELLDSADRAERRSSRRGRVAICALTVAALAFYLVHALGEQAAYLTTGYDLGIFDQAVRAYSHFQAPMVPLKGTGYNIFGDHFHPIIAVLAPLYWIWDSPNMLLIAQAVLTAWSVPVVYRFTRRRAGEVMSLVVAAAYAFGWPIQGLIDFDFHEVAFATPFLALAIDALDRRDDRRLVLWCALLLLVREDMGILVLLLGVLRLAQRRRPVNWRLIGGLVGGGLAMYVVTTSLIIPHFAAGHSFAYNNQFGSLGSSVPAALGNVITKPWHAVDVFFTPAVKAKTLGFLLLPLALLPLRSRYSILALPLLAEKFFNTRVNLWGATFHYNALPWLILVLATVDGAQRFGFFDATRRALFLRTSLATLLIATPAVLPIIGSYDDIIPITQARDGKPIVSTAWSNSARAVVAFLPKNVCVAVDNHLAPHLTMRDWTTVPQTDPYQPDFIAIDTGEADTGGNPPAPTPFDVLLKAQQAGYATVFQSSYNSNDSFIVLQRPGYSGPSAQCQPLGPGKAAPK